MLGTCRERPRRRSSVGVKFAFLTGTAAIIVVAIGSAIIFERLRSDATRQSEAVAHATANHVVAAVQSVFDGALGVVDTTHGNLIAMKDKGIKDPEAYNTILRRMIDTGTDRYGAWFVWAPGRSPLASAGVFRTYWHQNGMEILQDDVPNGVLDSDLYKVPAETSDSFLLEPHAIDAVNGDSTLVTSFARPLGDDGKDGVLAVDVKLDSISDALSTIDLPQGGRFSVVSDGGIVAASTTKNWAGKSLAAVSPSELQNFTAARKGDGNIFIDNADGTRSLQSYASIRFNGSKKPWFLLLEIPERSAFAAADREKLFLILVPTFGLLAILICVLLTMTRLVSQPLRTLSGTINGLGRGEFGFDVPGCERSDEVGDIARAVERLQGSLMEIGRLKEEGGEAQYQREKEREEELAGISSHFSRTIQTLVADLQNAAETVDAQSNDVWVKTDATIDRLSDVSGASRFAKESFGTVATATLSLASAISAISAKTHESQETALQVEERIVTTDRSISDLKNALVHIDGASKMVSGFATQINLIALNATIEAARAGDAGRGFAVVAQEVKTLAMHSAKATTAIGDQIADVRRAFSGADDRVGDMREAFLEMAALSKGIISALALQTDATGEIRTLVECALDRAENVERDMAALITSSNHIKSAAEGMRSQSAVLKEGVEGLSEEVDGFLCFLGRNVGHQARPPQKQRFE